MGALEKMWGRQAATEGSYSSTLVRATSTLTPATQSVTKTWYQPQKQQQASRAAIPLSQSLQSATHICDGVHEESLVTMVRTVGVDGLLLFKCRIIVPYWLM
jgi:hypothetical protein